MALTFWPPSADDLLHGLQERCGGVLVCLAGLACLGLVAWGLHGRSFGWLEAGLVGLLALGVGAVAAASAALGLWLEARDARRQAEGYAAQAGEAVEALVPLRVRWRRAYLAFTSTRVIAFSRASQRELGTREGLLYAQVVDTAAGRGALRRAWRDAWPESTVRLVWEPEGWPEEHEGFEWRAGVGWHWLKPETETGPETEPEPEPGPGPGTEPETEPEPEPGPGPGPETGPETEAEPGPGPETGPETEAEPGPETGPETETEAEAETGTGTETGPETGPETEAEPEPRPETGTETGTETETEAEAETTPAPEWPGWPEGPGETVTVAPWACEPFLRWVQGEGVAVSDPRRVYPDLSAAAAARGVELFWPPPRAEGVRYFLAFAGLIAAVCALPALLMLAADFWRNSPGLLDLYEHVLVMGRPVAATVGSIAAVAVILTVAQIGFLRLKVFRAARWVELEEGEQLQALCYARCRGDIDLEALPATWGEFLAITDRRLLAVVLGETKRATRQLCRVEDLVALAVANRAEGRHPLVQTLLEARGETQALLLYRRDGVTIKVMSEILFFEPLLAYLRERGLRIEDPGWVPEPELFDLPEESAEEEPADESAGTGAAQPVE